MVRKPSLCDPVGIQTLNLLIRSQILYSVELRSLFVARFVIAKAKVSSFLILPKLLPFFFIPVTIGLHFLAQNGPLGASEQISSRKIEKNGVCVYSSISERLRARFAKKLLVVSIGA